MNANQIKKKMENRKTVFNLSASDLIRVHPRKSVANIPMAPQAARVRSQSSRTASSRRQPMAWTRDAAAYNC